MAIDHSKIILISECFVKPKYKLEESKKLYYLIGDDLRMLSFRYSQKGFLYRKPTSSTCDFNINSFVEKLKHSLSHVLVYYYPLAGRFMTVKYEHEHACSIHVDCNKGSGARLIHASAVGNGVSVSDIVTRMGDAPIIMKYFFDLGETRMISYDGHTQPLLSLQVTELEDGVFIGTSVNHSLVDGASFMHFFNSLSEIFSKIDEKSDTLINISHVPIFKPVLPQGCKLIQKLPFLEPDEFITHVDNDPRLQERNFSFSSSSMTKLKSRANSECGTGSKISSFQALAALLWISINKAQKLPAQELSICVIPIDCRTRLDPALSSNHFGNLAQPLRVTKTVGELIENGLGWASMLLHQGISAYDDQIATQYLKGIMEKPSVMRLDMLDKLNIVNFAGGARFDMYGVDFGLGKATAVMSGNIDKRNGMVLLKEGREGRGSVELDVILSHESISALESDPDFMAYIS